MMQLTGTERAPRADGVHSSLGATVEDGPPVGEEETVRVEWPVKVEMIQDSNNDDDGYSADGSGGGVAASFVWPPPSPAVLTPSPAVLLFGVDGPVPTLSWEEKDQEEEGGGHVCVRRGGGRRYRGGWGGGGGRRAGEG